MIFESPLQRGTLIKRYKRFLADVELASGEIVTAHCPNTGSMRNCAQPGWTVWVSYQPSPKRKLAYTWELSQSDSGDLIGINTHRANKLVKEAWETKSIPELAKYRSLKAEVKYGQQNSRIDFLLSDANENRCYMEVKSVTLLDDNQSGRGLFPDATSVRGQKHLEELIEVKQQGHAACLLFCVQHTGIESVSPADMIDARYGSLLREAYQEGVEVIAYKCKITNELMELSEKIPVLI